jgi:hypothetical protein
LKSFGVILLSTGFLGSAFLGVIEADSAGKEWQTIPWGWYSLTFVTGVIGVIILRMSGQAASTLTHKLDADLATLTQSLAHVVERLGALVRQQNQVSVYDVHDRIDDELALELGRFADAREAIIHLYGLQPYADLMSHFALAERNINRAWSASADGYVDEVWKCLSMAQYEMGVAKETLMGLRDMQPATYRL